MDSNLYYEAKPISKAVISRLPRYYRYLRVLMEEGVEKISSKELSIRMNATASQIRQDLNNFGGFGQQGYGYNVKYLFEEIGNILGVGLSRNIIVIGAGNLGRAIVKYKGFEQQGFIFKALFDVDESLCGKSVNGVKIWNISELKEYLNKENEMNEHVDIAALTIPKSEAKDIADLLYESGIKYFWNFSHTDLELPNDAIIKNVHIMDSLLELSYSIKSAN